MFCSRLGCTFLCAVCCPPHSDERVVKETHNSTMTKEKFVHALKEKLLIHLTNEAVGLPGDARRRQAGFATLLWAFVPHRMPIPAVKPSPCMSVLS